MKFKVNNLEWDMKFEDSDKINLNEGDSVYFGLTDFTQQTILIRKGMSEQLARQTVIHELCHCFLFSYGCSVSSYDEELLCNLFGSHADSILALTDKFMKKGVKRNAFRS